MADPIQRRLTDRAGMAEVSEASGAAGERLTAIAGVLKKGNISMAEGRRMAAQMEVMAEAMDVCASRAKYTAGTVMTEVARRQKVEEQRKEMRVGLLAQRLMHTKLTKHVRQLGKDAIESLARIEQITSTDENRDPNRSSPVKKKVCESVGSDPLIPTPTHQSPARCV